MSSCLSGGGRTYGFEFDIVKSSSTSAQTLHTTTSSSSPSSTLSESSNSPLTISTRKPRTPRKRPNQIYKEAAALLSTAYPTIFSTKHITKNPSKFTKKNEHFYDESSVLLLPFRVIDDFGIPLPLVQEKPNFQFEQRVSSFTYPSITSPIEIDSLMNSNSNSLSCCDGYVQDDDFDAESILEEEIEEGIIDSIMGNLSENNSNNSTSCYGCPTPMQMGLGNFGGKIELGYGIKWGFRGALRPVDDGDWWRFPAVDVGKISPRITITNSNNNTKVSNSDVKKKKKKKVEKTAHEHEETNEAANVGKSPNSELSEETKQLIQANAGSGLLLKLNFDGVLSAWSDRGSPFSEEILGSEIAGNDDVHARLAQIDLGLENGGVREASVLRYKEKRRTRLFSKKIRYQVRKVNADRRPRMKGRFVRRPNSNGRVVV